MSDQGIALSGHFPSETVDALFAAVEVDDVVDPEVSLPEPIRYLAVSFPKKSKG